MNGIWGTWIAIDPDTEEVISEGFKGETYGHFERGTKKALDRGRVFEIHSRAAYAIDHPKALARWDAERGTGYE